MPGLSLLKLFYFLWYRLFSSCILEYFCSCQDFSHLEIRSISPIQNIHFMELRLISLCRGFKLENSINSLKAEYLFIIKFGLISACQGFPTWKFLSISLIQNKNQFHEIWSNLSRPGLDQFDQVPESSLEQNIYWINKFVA